MFRKDRTILANEMGADPAILMVGDKISVMLLVILMLKYQQSTPNWSNFDVILTSL